MDIKRAHDRVEESIAVTVKHGEDVFSAESENLSLGGMFLRTQTSIRFGTTLSLNFRLPSLEEDTVVEAVVRWTSEEGVGVQFLNLRTIDVWGINKMTQPEA